MPLYRPTELFEFLHSLGRGAKRTLSQNFLIDGNVVHNIVEKIDLPAGAMVIEIGPGPGVLTEALLDKGYCVIAIETDADFARVLSRLNPAKDRLRVVEADVLKLSLQEWSLDPENTVIVSNLPYHITTPILHWLCKERDHFCRALLMMQREVAEKCAGTSSTTSAQVELRLLFDVKKEFRVSRQCFTPSPKIDSEVISLIKTADCIEDCAFLIDLVRKCFVHRRKAVFATFSLLYGRDRASEMLEKAGVSLQARSEEIQLDQWRVVGRVLRAH